MRANQEGPVDRKAMPVPAPPADTVGTHALPFDRLLLLLFFFLLLFSLAFLFLFFCFVFRSHLGVP